MVTIAVDVSYTLYGYQQVELPEGKTWADVKEHWVKWDKLNLIFKDGAEMEYDLNTEVIGDGIDWKRPNSYEIRPTKENGDTDYNVMLANA